MKCVIPNLRARTGVGENKGDPLFRRPALRAGLDHRVFMGAGQARQIPQDGHGAVFRLSRQEKTEGHVGARGLGCVFVDALHTAETGVLGKGLHGEASFIGLGQSREIQPTTSDTVTMLSAVEIRIEAETRCGAMP